MQEQIENKGYIPELSQLPKHINCICEIIATFWDSYKREKTSIMQYQSSWLNEIETIVLTCAHWCIEQNVKGLLK